MRMEIEPNVRHMPPPDAVLVFAAAGHLGGPVADELRRIAPETRLRLATSTPSRVEALQAHHPDAEVVVADYGDPASLQAAFAGMSGAFIVTPSFIDEVAAMGNVVAAAREAGSIRHIVRITGDPPHVHSEEDVPPALTARGNGTAVNHIRARRVLRQSGLPVTYLNIAAFLMDNILRMMAPGIRRDRKVILPFDRHMSWVDPGDVGRAAARVLTSGDRFHLDKKYHLENGIDCLTFSELAALMSRVLGEPIAYSDSVEDYVASRAGGEADYSGEALRYWLEYMKWEQTADTVWRRTDVFTTLFGFQPRSLEDWLKTHRDSLLGLPEAAA